MTALGGRAGVSLWDKLVPTRATHACGQASWLSCWLTASLSVELHVHAVACKGSKVLHANAAEKGTQLGVNILSGDGTALGGRVRAKFAFLACAHSDKACTLDCASLTSL